MKRSVQLMAALTMVALVGCSSTTSKGGEATTESSAPTTLPPATSGSLTTTTVVATTEAPRTGWVTIDPTSLTGRQLSPPCCGADWYGEPSPPLPADGGPLLDGDYAVLAEWPAEVGAPLELQVYRFEACNELPEGTCENPEDPEAIGVDRSYYVALTLPLDGDLKVVLVGFAGFESMDTSSAQGTGTDLAELAVAVEQAYDEVFAARLEGGEFAPDIVADVRANPVAGFGPADDGSDLSVSFVANGAPPLLFQSPFAYTEPPSPIRGTDVLHLTSLGASDGRLTIYVYAGFYS